jgi:hypothetical protein
MKRRIFIPWLLAVTAAFTAKAQKPSSSVKNPFTNFLNTFPPDGEIKPFTKTLSSDLKKHAHPLLISFWQTVGFGSFGDGFLHFFHPDEYAEVMAQWLMANKTLSDKIPFARTAFGDLFYFRDLRERAKSLNLTSSLEEASDIAFLSVHYGKTEIISHKVEQFFNTDLSSYLKESKFPMYPLYQKLRNKMPKPSVESCYFFQPALMLGGKPDIKHIGSGDCQVHLDILYQFRSN